ncbi:MAG: hypothetical protein IT385_27290 [Deltaproteobacteria bacterium]|nr:hypothetical protein [Deltaproteobacteria bacterium]
MRSWLVISGSLSMCVACAPAPGFQAGEATGTDSSPSDGTTTEVAPDGDDETDDTAADPCEGCAPGERCVDGTCESCAEACVSLVSADSCGDDGCGGACGCSTLGLCASGSCICGNDDCLEVVSNTGARSMGATFDQRDHPVFVIGTGDDIVVRRAGSIVRWSGVSFDSEEVDVSKPSSDGGSIVVTPEGVIHAVFAGTELTQEVPRHVIREGASWRVTNVGSERCLAAELALYQGKVLLGCFDKTTATAVFRTWDDDAGTWTRLTTSTAIAGDADPSRWFDEWDWTVDAQSGEIVVAYVRRTESTTRVAIKTYTPEDVWKDKDLDDLVNTDPTFVHRLAVVRDGFSKTRVVVRDKVAPDDVDNLVLRQLLETKDGATPTVAWQGEGLDAGRVFACAPLPGAGVDIAVRDRFTVQHLGWSGDGETSAWGEPVVLDLGIELIQQLEMALDASGRRHVAILTDSTVVRLWAPTGTPPRLRLDD